MDHRPSVGVVVDDDPAEHPADHQRRHDDHRDVDDRQRDREDEVPAGRRGVSPEAGIDGAPGTSLPARALVGRAGCVAYRCAHLRPSGRPIDGGMCSVRDPLAEHPVRPALVDQHHRGERTRRTHVMTFSVYGLDEALSMVRLYAASSVDGMTLGNSEPNSSATVADDRRSPEQRERPALAPGPGERDHRRRARRRRSPRAIHVQPLPAPSCVHSSERASAPARPAIASRGRQLDAPVPGLRRPSSARGTPRRAGRTASSVVSPPSSA